VSDAVSFVDPEFIADPYPGLARLRTHGKPVWSDELGIFLAATHKDANQVLRTRSLGRIFQPKQPEDQWNTFNYLHADSILDSEPPKHTRLRSLVTKAFNPKKIDSLRPTVATIVDTLLDDLEDAFSDAEMPT
jgi:cytochrome P450